MGVRSDPARDSPPRCRVASHLAAGRISTVGPHRFCIVSGGGDGGPGEPQIAEQLSILTLGGLELLRSARPLPGLTSVKAKALVAYLAVTGQPETRSRLAGLLWSDAAEDTARANLRLTLTRLRKALGDQITADRRTVALAGPYTVDVAAIDERPLEVYAGEFLHGLELPGAPLFEEWADERRREYRTIALAALDRELGLALDRDDAARGIAIARRILQLEPTNEPAHRALMTCFAATGRPSAAVAQFQTCRHTLTEELDVEPAAETVAIYEKARRSAVPAGDAGAGDVAVGTIAAGAPMPPARDLVGRRGELGQLDGLLDDPSCRMVTLVGPGGIGKTRIAAEAAARWREHGGEACFVDLAGARPASADDASALLTANLAAAVGASLAANRDPVELIAARIAGRPMLVVLDNLEHLHAAGGTLVRLVERTPSVRWLATSRRRVGIGPEWVLEIAGLAVPPEGVVTDLERFDAVRLFERRARPLASNGELESPAVARICRMVEGMPLAIELAARWIASASPDTIADRLATDLDLLSTDAPDVDARHRSLRAAIGGTAALLDDRAREALARCSAFRGSFDLAAAEAVADTDLATLSQLVDHSLVARVGSGRYRLHQLIRHFAAEAAAERPDEVARLEQRHAEYFAGLLRTSDPAGLDPATVEDLRAATGWMVAHASADELVAHLDRMWRLYRHRTWYREASSVVAAALRRDDLPAAARAHLAATKAMADAQVGSIVEIRDELAKAAAAVCRWVPGTRPGWVVRLLAESLRQVAHRAGSAGLPLPGRRGRRGMRAAKTEILRHLGESLYFHEDWPAFFGTTAWLLNEAELSGRRELIAEARVSAALVAGPLVSQRTGARYLESALELLGADAGADPASAGWAHMVAVLYWLGVGSWQRLAPEVEASVAACRRAALHRAEDQARLLGGIGRTYQGELDAAHTVFRTVEDEARLRGNPTSHLWALVAQAEAAVRMGEHERAAPLVVEADELSRYLEQRIDGVRIDVLTARIALARGDLDAAQSAAARAAASLGTAPSFAAYTVDGHAGVPEVCLDLIESGRDTPEIRAGVRDGTRAMRRFASALPVARPRLQLVRGRVAAARGRRGTARRALHRAATSAERMGLPYEQRLARDELARLAGDR